jgi:hypothetical protein
MGWLSGSIFGMIIVISMFVNMIYYVVLIDKKIQLEYVLRPYLITFSDQGYLSDEDKDELMDKVEFIGLTDVELSLENEHGYFSDIGSIQISGYYNNENTGLFSELQVNTPIEINRDVIIRRIEN